MLLIPGLHPGRLEGMGPEASMVSILLAFLSLPRADDAWTLPSASLRRNWGTALPGKELPGGGVSSLRTWGIRSYRLDPFFGLFRVSSLFS